MTAASPDGATLGKIGALIDAGQVKPVVTAVFPLSAVREAHALSESLHARGKIVLSVAD